MRGKESYQVYKGVKLNNPQKAPSNDTFGGFESVKGMKQLMKDMSNIVVDKTKQNERQQ